MAARHEVAFINPGISDLAAHNAPSKREIAFIDRGVDDLATLLSGLRPDVEPILLSNDEPAPRQMARADVGSCGAGALSLETIDERKDEVAAFGLEDHR